MKAVASIDSLRELPIVATAPADGRLVLLHQYFDTQDQSWHLFLPVNDEIQDGKIADLASGTYLATAPADASRDYLLTLETLLFRHLSFPRVTGAYEALSSDFHQCAAVLELYERLAAESRDEAHSSFLVAAQLEYLVFLLRALYDSLQGVIRAIADHVVTLDEEQRKIVRNLPGSFADIALRKNAPRDPADITAKYGLPQQFAEWYHSEAPTFAFMRNIRDDIAHRGRDFPLALKLPEGFAVDITQHPWKGMQLWEPELLLKGNLGSLRMVFVSLIAHAIAATDRFGSVTRQLVRLPPAVHPDLACYLRSPFGRHLVGLSSVRKQPWEGRDAAV